MPYPKKFDVFIEEDIVNLYLEGATAQTIGRKYNIASTTIYRILDRYNVARHKTGKRKGSVTKPWSEEEEATLVALRKQGLSYGLIAEWLERPESTVAYKVKKLCPETPEKVIRKKS